MRRIAVLAGSILFFGAQTLQAQHMGVSVGIGMGGGGGGHYHDDHRDHRDYHYNHYHGHGDFVYQSYWHHSGWVHVWLDPQFTYYLDPYPFVGPGYQLVNVYFDDGSVLNNVYVYNYDQIELPPEFAGRAITQVEVVPPPPPPPPPPQPSVQVGVGVSVGSHHLHFVYKNYWHHRHWVHVRLAPRFTTYLSSYPYAGSGYQMVNVYFADGSVLNNVYVYNMDQIELPSAFSGRRIVRLVVVGD